MNLSSRTEKKVDCECDVTHIMLICLQIGIHFTKLLGILVLSVYDNKLKNFVFKYISSFHENLWAASHKTGLCHTKRRLGWHQSMQAFFWDGNNLEFGLLSSQIIVFSQVHKRCLGVVQTEPFYNDKSFRVCYCMTQVLYNMYM